MYLGTAQGVGDIAVNEDQKVNYLLVQFTCKKRIMFTNKLAVRYYHQVRKTQVR
jgi:hypothetical protein